MQVGQFDEIVAFAAKHHEGFMHLPEPFLYKFFRTYADNTLIVRDGNGDITGFAVYQDWGDLLNFLAICNVGDDNKWMFRLRALGKNGKKLCYFDESKMKVKELGKCHH